MSKETINFSDFLLKAKINTYAGNGPKSLPTRPHSKDLTYQEGDYLYIDSYLGTDDFVGEEVVWHEGKIFWGMNYYGKCLEEEIPEGMTNFLKEALKKPSTIMPLRGPKYFKQGDFKYKCSYDGDLDCFSGEEEIFYKGKKVYFLMFHGGILK